MRHPPITHRQAIFCIVLLAFAAFAPTFKTGFMWDDHVMIEANPYLRSWSLDNLKHDFTSDVFNGYGDLYYRPGQTMLNRVDYTIWGLHAFGYHLTNWLAHVGCAILVMELALVLGMTALAGFLAASLFAVHPIIVQEMMILAGRAEIVGLFLLLLSLRLLLSNIPRRRVIGYGVFGLSLLFKESNVIGPVLLGILLTWRKDPPECRRRIVPMVLLAGAFMLMRHWAIGSDALQLKESVALKFWTMAFPRVLGLYTGLLAWPWNLHSHHMIPRLSYFWITWLIFWPALLIALWKTRMRKTFFGVLWYVICFIPKTLPMMNGGFMLEHWAYPSLVPVTWGLGALFAGSWDRPKLLLSRILIPAYLLILITWSLLAHLSIELRSTDEKNYRWSLRFTESRPIQYNLGVLLLQTNRPQEATYYLENVRSSYPEDVRNLHALAQAYARMGEPRAALRFIKDAMVLLPSDPEIQKTYAAITQSVK